MRARAAILNLRDCFRITYTPSVRGQLPVGHPNVFESQVSNYTRPGFKNCVRVEGSILPVLKLFTTVVLTAALPICSLSDEPGPRSAGAFRPPATPLEFPGHTRIRIEGESKVETAGRSDSGPPDAHHRRESDDLLGYGYKQERILLGGHAVRHARCQAEQQIRP